MTITSEASIGENKAVKASIKTEFKQGNLVCDNITVSSDSKVEAKFTLKEALPKTALSFKASDAKKEKGAEGVGAELSAQYADANASLVAKVDALKYSLSAEAAYKANSFVVGASFKTGDGGAFKVADYNAIVAYKTDKVTAGLQTEKSLSTLKAAYSQAVSADVTTFGSASVPLLAKDDKKGVAIEFGAQYKATKDSTHVGKVSNAGLVSYSYAAPVDALSKITVAAEINAADFASDNHRVGFVLNIAA